MHPSASWRRTNPLAFAIRKRGAAIQAHRPFKKAPGTAGLNTMDKSSVLLSRFFLEYAGDDLQTRVPQTLNATTSNTRIRILKCHDHALNAGLNHSLRAGGSAALVTTGLERDDDRAALGALTGLSKRAHLGMGLTCFGVKTFAR